jgi:uncharacterized protein (DUF58 family)
MFNEPEESSCDELGDLKSKVVQVRVNKHSSIVKLLYKNRYRAWIQAHESPERYTEPAARQQQLAAILNHLHQVPPSSPNYRRHRCNNLPIMHFLNLGSPPGT